MDSSPQSPQRLRRRPDFIAASKGRRAAASALTVQARTRDDAAAPRVGLTVSKKVGNAVERNRVRRRLRAAVRLSAAERLAAGNDYVVVARREALSLPFARLTADLVGALARLGRAHGISAHGVSAHGPRAHGTEGRPDQHRGGGHRKKGPPPHGVEQGPS